MVCVLLIELLKNKEMVKKHKYWYNTIIYSCALCGREKRNRERVYNKAESGTEWIDDACWSHF